MGLNAGDLDREITLETATKTQDAATGEELIDWSTVEPEALWAAWYPAGTREAYFAQQRLAATVDGVFRIYFREPKPTPEGNRIVFDGDTYDITGVTEIERREGFELAVVARA